ncbi:MAG TPA: lysophospholipid acyltransferase family protein [Syntrophorhabdales bacterium]|nr:lysophospholipid acyltransferase family protein [Syntrophorhabdales bacterium]
MLKRLKYLIMLNLLPPAIYLFLLLLGATMRITQVNREKADRLWQDRQGVIVCFWHGRLLAMPFAYMGSRAKVLISRHGDGEFIARVIKYFGLGAVRASYRKATVGSIREILAELKQGTIVGITPDGPKGPRYRIKEGIVEIAKLAQRPILPVAYGADRKKVFASWDRFVLPYPFSRILFLWGDPVYVPKEASGNAVEQIRRDLENALVSLTEAADRMVCGS